MPPPESVEPKSIRLLILDVDGVMTDGGVWLDHKGREIKRFNAQDGMGIQLWHEAGGKTAIITGRSSGAVTQRASELGITCVHQGVKDKLSVFHNILGEFGITAVESTMLGDDLADLPVMTSSGYPMAVANATPEVLYEAFYITEAPGGHGAVREAIEHLLSARGEWDKVINQFRLTP